MRFHVDHRSRFRTATAADQRACNGLPFRIDASLDRIYQIRTKGLHLIETDARYDVFADDHRRDEGLGVLDGRHAKSSKNIYFNINFKKNAGMSWSILMSLLKIPGNY